MVSSIMGISKVKIGYVILNFRRVRLGIIGRGKKKVYFTEKLIKNFTSRLKDNDRSQSCRFFAFKYSTFVCHDILMCKSPIKWRPCPDMVIAVDWDVKHIYQSV